MNRSADVRAAGADRGADVRAAGAARRAARYLVSAAVLLAGLVAAPLEAGAWTNDYDHPRFFVINGRFGIGGGWGGWGSQFQVGLDLGFRVFKDAWKSSKVDQGDALYLGLTPQFGLGDEVANAFFLPFTGQYDIPLPVKGLYVYPRSEVGFGFCTFRLCNQAYFSMAHMGGVKFHVGKHFQVGGDVGFAYNFLDYGGYGGGWGYVRGFAFVGGQFGG